MNLSYPKISALFIEGSRVHPRHVAESSAQLLQDGHGNVEGFVGGAAGATPEVRAQAHLRHRRITEGAMLSLGTLRVHL